MLTDDTVAHQEHIYSRLSSDPDLRDIVEMFVEEMPDRIASLTSLLESAEWDGLRRTAHQLKGAAGSYGFDVLSPCAGKVETAIDEGKSTEEIHQLVMQLVEMCRRCSCGSR